MNESEKPTPSGDDAVPEADQVDSAPHGVGSDEDPDPAEEPSGGSNSGRGGVDEISERSD